MGGDGNNTNDTNVDAITQEDESVDSTYHLKWIQWNSGKIPIIMQSKNGPCPLIATINVLLLREKVKLPQVLEQITSNQLFTYLAECIMDYTLPEDLQNDESAILNLEQNVHDAIEILPKLSTGLDVNIRFTGITDFEYTPECIIFDLLRIPLYHGWLIDPNLIELRDAIGNQSYNQLVDNIITNKNSPNPDIQTKVLISEEFLERTASQLTLHGLNELKNKIKDNEVGILFRNNHFLTLLKRGSEIYTLVTDHGYLTEDNIIWETLDNVEGVGRFFDSNFQISEMSSKQITQYVNNDKRLQQMEMDFLLALSLREDEGTSSGQQQNQSEQIPEDAHKTTSIQAPDDDFEFAKRLQAEEDEIYQEMMQKESANKRQHQQQQPQLIDNRLSNEQKLKKSKTPYIHSSSSDAISSEQTSAAITSEPPIEPVELQNPISNRQETEECQKTSCNSTAGTANDTNGSDTSDRQQSSTYSEVVQQQQQQHQHQHQHQHQDQSSSQQHSSQHRQQRSSSATTTNRSRSKNSKDTTCIVN